MLKSKTNWIELNLSDIGFDLIKRWLEYVLIGWFISEEYVLDIFRVVQSIFGECRGFEILAKYFFSWFFPDQTKTKTRPGIKQDCCAEFTILGTPSHSIQCLKEPLHQDANRQTRLLDCLLLRGWFSVWLVQWVLVSHRLAIANIFIFN